MPAKGRNAPHKADTPLMNYIKIDIRNNSKKELKTKVCQTHDEIFVSSFSVQHKNFVFGHLLKYTKTV